MTTFGVLCTGMVTTSKERHWMFRMDSTRGNQIGQRIKAEKLRRTIKVSWFILITANKTL